MSTPHVFCLIYIRTYYTHPYIYTIIYHSVKIVDTNVTKYPHTVYFLFENILC